MLLGALAKLSSVHFGDLPVSTAFAQRFCNHGTVAPIRAHLSVHVCTRRAAEQRDELAAFHSITSSARASSVGGTVRPNVLAVSALMTSSNLLACTTGRSAGFVPLRMWPA